MSSPEPCPDDNRLIRASSGEAGEEELAQLERHLDRCADCRRVLAGTGTHRGGALPGRLLPLVPGATLARYTIGRLLGAGGMGVVHEAIDPVLDRTVALKVLRSSEHEESNARLAREAQTMARLSHPNLVPVFELGEWEGRLFLAMERVDGFALDVWRTREPRTLEQISRVLFDAGHGLAAAHACGVVHRDFKPANVLVGGDGRARVTDFGLSRLSQPGTSPPSASMLETQAGTLLGTPAYMSPEQLDGLPADGRSDQFSFCVTVAEALGGVRPFSAPTCKALREAMRGPPDLTQVPRRYRAALSRGLAEDPSARFPSMQPLLAALAPRRGASRGALAVAMAAIVVAGTLGVLRALEETVEVAVAAVDLREGELLTPDKLVLREVPKRLVTSSVVRPDSTRYIQNQPLNVPVQAGDLLLWSQFERRPGQVP